MHPPAFQIWTPSWIGGTNFDRGVVLTSNMKSATEITWKTIPHMKGYAQVKIPIFRRHYYGRHFEF